MVKDKNLTIFFNCHGNYIYFYLKKYLTSNFNIKWIYIAEFEGGGGNRKYFNNEEINILSNTDILIVQYIKNDRAFLNHDKVIQLTRNTTTIIKIPHYTYHGNNYKNLSDYINFHSHLILQLNEVNSINKKCDFKELKKNIDLKYNEERNNHIEDYNKHKFDCLESIKMNDNNSDVKLYELCKYYYNTKLLFNEPWHPNSFFIYLMVIEILKYLELEYKKEYISVYEIFNETQFDIDKDYIELIYESEQITIDSFYKNIGDKNILLYENYLFNGRSNILYNPIDIPIKNDIILIKKLDYPNDNIIKIQTKQNIYYISTFIKEKINIKNYIYFHSDLILQLNEVNESNLENYKEHPSCSNLLNKKNYLLINKDNEI